MKLQFRLFMVVLMLAAMPVKAADLFLSVKAGMFELKEDTFSSGAYGTTIIDTASISSGAIGLEWLLRDKWMVGLEIYKMKHDWIAVGGETGDLESRLVVFSGKRLFNTDSVVQPYVGAGIGLVDMDFSTGDIWDNELASIVHLGGGVIFKFGDVAAYAETRYIEMLSTFAEYDYTGSGIYAGLRFGF
ncbi:MAG: outer membrane beta-barrel protein [Pseudomonadota bacterium]